jgi:muramoyltetrapeptide carboxypeptidase LdcA involved in peptidoglycan recycling
MGVQTVFPSTQTVFPSRKSAAQRPAPAVSAHSCQELKASQENPEALGFKVAYAKTILAKAGDLAGTDAQRAEALQEMFSRNAIHGIVAARGGDGCTRLRPLLDSGRLWPVVRPHSQ